MLVTMRQLHRGDRVRVTLHDSYRYFLDGLEGRVTAVLCHGVVVAIENDPFSLERILAVNNRPPARPPPKAQYIFQFNEIVKIP